MRIFLLNKTKANNFRITIKFYQNPLHQQPTPIIMSKAIKTWVTCSIQYQVVEIINNKIIITTIMVLLKHWRKKLVCLSTGHMIDQVQIITTIIINKIISSKINLTNKLHQENHHCHQIKLQIIKTWKIIVTIHCLS